MSVDLQEQTRKLLEEPLLGEQDLDAKIRRLLEGEYMRRKVQYRGVDRNLRQKCGTTFEDFTANRVVPQEGYTWEAEIAPMDSETAMDGIDTLRHKLQEIQHAQQDGLPLSRQPHHALLAAYSGQVVHVLRGCRPPIPMRSEKWSACRRNGWTASIGVGGRHGPDHAFNDRTNHTVSSASRAPSWTSVLAYTPEFL